MNKIHFHNADKILWLKGKRELQVFIKDIFRKEKMLLEKVDYIFCSDDYLLSINQNFLNHDYFTDTITFRLNDYSSPILGEVYISLDRVKENALNFKTSFREEFCRVIFHSTLHLCGYNDQMKGEKTIMRQKEDYYLSLFKKSST